MIDLERIQQIPGLEPSYLNDEEIFEAADNSINSLLKENKKSRFDRFFSSPNTWRDRRSLIRISANDYGVVEAQIFEDNYTTGRADASIAQDVVLNVMVNHGLHHDTHIPLIGDGYDENGVQDFGGETWEGTVYPSQLHPGIIFERVIEKTTDGNIQFVEWTAKAEQENVKRGIIFSKS